MLLHGDSRLGCVNGYCAKIVNGTRLHNERMLRCVGFMASA
jgi:hypothetical protein